MTWRQKEPSAAEMAGRARGALGGDEWKGEMAEWDRLLEPSRLKPEADLEDAKMPFGKHRGKALRLLPVEYLGWLLSLSDLKEPLARRIRAEADRRKGKRADVDMEVER